MKVGDLVKHRVVSLGVGIVTSIHRTSMMGQRGQKITGPGSKMVYVLWSKSIRRHRNPGPNLEIPESLEAINESR